MVTGSSNLEFSLKFSEIRMLFCAFQVAQDCNLQSLNQISKLLALYIAQ